ncbi:hypothetical protein KI387_031521, partial [Taxus chinensis]
INHFAHTPSQEWFQTDAVLRVSLGNFLFFTIFALLMIGVKDQRDTRDSWHHGGWMGKIIAWCILIVLMFFVPNGVVGVYETLAKFGSGLFLLVQVVLLLDFTHTWNDAWVAKDEQFWYIALFVVSLVCYIATFSFSGLLFLWFNPSSQDCGLNMFFIVMTLGLAFVFAVVALHPKCTSIQRMLSVANCLDMLAEREGKLEDSLKVKRLGGKFRLDDALRNCPLATDHAFAVTKKALHAIVATYVTRYTRLYG